MFTLLEFTPLQFYCGPGACLCNTTQNYGQPQYYSATRLVGNTNGMKMIGISFFTALYIKIRWMHMYIYIFI